MNELAKAEQFLQVAKVAQAMDKYDACACLSYHAVFWAAQAMLRRIGVRREKWRHDELRKIFGLECIVRRQLCPSKLGRQMKMLYELRLSAVYETELLTKRRGAFALQVAESFVQKAMEVCR